MVVPTIFLALARVFVKNENPRGRSTSLTTAGKCRESLQHREGGA